MTSLVRHQLHDLISQADNQTVISVCNDRSDVCRFILHLFADHVADTGNYDSAFAVLRDWSHCLHVPLPEEKQATTPSFEEKSPAPLDRSRSISPFPFISTSSDFSKILSRTTWTYIGLFVDSDDKALSLHNVSREFNMIFTHPNCWEKLSLRCHSLQRLPTCVIRRSFIHVNSLTLTWPISESKITDENKMIVFKNIAKLCPNIHSFKLAPGGGPFRLASSAPTAKKFAQTESLLNQLSQFHRIRKIKMDAYNIVSLRAFCHMMAQPSLANMEFLEIQILVFDNVMARPALDTPVSLGPNILPPTIRHLSLPLLADDSWITQQVLPNLEYLFFFGFSRSSAYALHENHLSIACLNHIAGSIPKKDDDSTLPNSPVSSMGSVSSRGSVPQNPGTPRPLQATSPKIRRIEVALRQTDYMAVILRPVVRKLFKRCPLLDRLRLATAGDLMLAQNLLQTLTAGSWDQVDDYVVTAERAGRPARPTAFVEFNRAIAPPERTRNRNWSESDVSELAVGCRL